MERKFRFKNLTILVLMGVFLCGFIKQEITINRIKKELKEKTSTLEDVKETNQKLSEEVGVSQTDEYSEKLAREKLNMLKDGEKTVEQGETSVFSSETSTATQAEESTSN